MSTTTMRPRRSSAFSGSEFSQTGASPNAARSAWMGYVVATGASSALVPLPAEQLEQEQEHVEDVEEDAAGDHHGAAGIRAAQAVEVEDRERTEDPEPGDGVDEQDQPGRPAEVAPEVGAEGGKGDRNGDQAHDLAQQFSTAVVRDGSAGERRLVVGGPDGGHEVSSCMWAAGAGRRQRRRD